MFGWLRKILPERQKDNPVVIDGEKALTQISEELGQNAVDLERNLKLLRKDQKTLIDIFDEVVIMVRSEKRK